MVKLNRCHTLAILLVVVATCTACTRAAPSAATPVADANATATAQAVAFCDLRVDGNSVTTPSGQPVVLHGADVPSISAMEASSYTADARLRDLAAAGARIVRLPIEERELSPTFVPAKVAPFTEQANRLGMVVVLSWSGVISDPVNNTVDDADDWIRLVIQYLGSRPGVGFELYEGTSGISPLRQRNIAQRLVDAARGNRANNIIVVNNPAWLLESDPAVNQPLAGGNIVYGLDARAGLPPLKTSASSSGYPVEQYPFIVTRWGGDADAVSKQLTDVKALNLGTIASLGEPQTLNIPAPLSEFWKANAFDWTACH
jgi:hypothetical protein